MRKKNAELRELFLLGAESLMMKNDGAEYDGLYTLAKYEHATQWWSPTKVIFAVLELWLCRRYM